eukprot:jgi/Bigna1/77190/fgenesh1_pg.46_\
MTKRLVDVVFYNVLFGLTWDPDFEPNQTTLEDGSPAFLHKMKKFVQHDWREAFGDTDRYDKAIPASETGRFAKFIEIFEAKARYKRLEAKLDEEIRSERGAGRPIICMSEVQESWAKMLEKFFAKRNYTMLFDPGSTPHRGYNGLTLAYPSERYAVLECVKQSNFFPTSNIEEAMKQVRKTGCPRSYPLQGYEDVLAPAETAVENLLKGPMADGGASQHFSVSEILKMYKVVEKTKKKPIILLPLRILTANGDNENRETTEEKAERGQQLKSPRDFLLGVYHMPMLWGWDVNKRTSYAVTSQKKEKGEVGGDGKEEQGGEVRNKQSKKVSKEGISLKNECNKDQVQNEKKIGEAQRGADVIKKRQKKRRGDADMMAIHAFTAIRKFSMLKTHIQAQIAAAKAASEEAESKKRMRGGEAENEATSSPSLPTIIVGDWNVKPENRDSFDMFLSREWVRSRTEIPANHMIELIFASTQESGGDEEKLIGKAKTMTTKRSEVDAASGKKNQTATFQVLESLDHFKLKSAYETMFGKHPELTTHTQEFVGALDHMFMSPDVKVEWMQRMPTKEEALKQKLWTPNKDTEPSDHLLQRAVFGV